MYDHTHTLSRTKVCAPLSYPAINEESIILRNPFRGCRERMYMYCGTNKETHGLADQTELHFLGTHHEVAWFDGHHPLLLLIIHGEISVI